MLLNTASIICIHDWNMIQIYMVVFQPHWARTTILLPRFTWALWVQASKVLLHMSCIIMGHPWPNKVVDLDSLASHLTWGFEMQPGTLDSFMWGSYLAWFWNISGSTQVQACAWNTAWSGLWGLPPPVKLDSHHISFTVFVWRKTQPKKKFCFVVARIKRRWEDDPWK